MTRRALLLAAGEGTRLRPLTETLPKPMIPIAGKPILQHNIELLAQHGIREIAINLHHCPDVVTLHFGDGSRFGVSITYSYEPELLGTAGAVKKLASFFQDATQAVIASGAKQSPPPPFLVVYGDNLVNCDLHRLLAFHRKHKGIATIALHHRDDVRNSGVVSLDAQDRVTSFVEKPQTEDVPSHWVNAGVLVLEPQVLQSIPADVPSDFGRDILPRLLEQSQPMYGYRFGEGEWIRWIDTHEDLERVRQMAEGGMRRLKKAREKAA